LRFNLWFGKAIGALNVALQCARHRDCPLIRYIPDSKDKALATFSADFLDHPSDYFMIEGLSTIEIKLDIGELLTSGIGVFFDGGVLGGDTRCIYAGSYRIDPTGRAYATVTIAHYSQSREAIFGNNRESTPCDFPRANSDRLTLG
jgi:hypothetical protein